MFVYWPATIRAAGAVGPGLTEIEQVGVGVRVAAGEGRVEIVGRISGSAVVVVDDGNAADGNVAGVGDLIRERGGAACRRESGRLLNRRPGR